MTAQPILGDKTGYIYLATPYSRYSRGLDAAWTLACRAAGAFAAAGIPVYSPIAHTHPIAEAVELDPLDHGIWMPLDYPLMSKAAGLAVLMASGWTESKGVQIEIEWFDQAGRPVFYIAPPSEVDSGAPYALPDDARQSMMVAVRESQND